MDPENPRHEPIRPTAGLEHTQADAVVARLSALTQAARVFGSGVADVDLDIGWTLPGKPERMLWVTGEGGRRRVELRLDLDRMVEAMSARPEEQPQTHVEGFQSAFLHELGHVLYSGRPPGEPLLDDDRCKELGSCLPDDTRRLTEEPKVRLLLNEVGDILEDARIERRLIDRFRGAHRYLHSHAAEALQVARGEEAPGPAPTSREPGGTGETGGAVAPPPTVLGPGDELALGTCAGTGESPTIDEGTELHLEETAGDRQTGPPRGAHEAQELARMVALLYLQIAGLEEQVPAESVPAHAAATAERLRDPLLAAIQTEDPSRFADWLVTDLLAELARSFPAIFESAVVEPGSEQRGPGAAAQAEPEERHPGDEGAEEEQGPSSARTQSAPAGTPSAEAGDAAVALLATMAERLMSPGLLGSGARVATAGEGQHPRESPLQRRIIVYPHMDGTLLIDEVAVANARSVAPTVQSKQVLEQVVRRYGAPALDAFAAERAALRRAFEVNFERRFAGRYRAGKRVGVRNLRRMAVSRDLRLFQKLEVPDRLSYYFHLLIDVSPSMLTDRNAAKAIAVGYAFTEALDRLRVPVDVSLYSAAITELYDHRRDRLDLFFGGDFGYYSSGTHEIEAIACAKQKADAVDQTRKLIVVLTDGHPNSVALHRAGSADLRTYYRAALIPWLRASDVDLLAIGIGHSPAYHENAVSIGSSWQSIGVFMRLLDAVIAEGRRSHAALWQ